MSYRCQSAYKLLELDTRFRLFNGSKCHTVLDLAAAPGGFAQVALEGMRRHSTSLDSRSTFTSSNHCVTSLAEAQPLLDPLVVAVDLRRIEPLPGMRAIQCNLLDHQKLLYTLQDVLVHDGKGSSRGRGRQRTLDGVTHDGVSVVQGQYAFSVTYAQSQMTLSALQLACEAFARFAPGVTNPPFSSEKQKKGDALPPRQKPCPVFFVSKVMKSSHYSRVVQAARTFFSSVYEHKPESCKAESLETYIVARGFLSRRWAAHQRHGYSGRKCGSVLSFPPTAEDVLPGRQVVWHCLGCGHNRLGVAPCPLCSVRC